MTFIQDHIHEDLPFNKTAGPGNHHSLIVHAAQERNLTVKNLSRDHTVFLDEGVAIGGMYKMVTSLVSHPAISATNSKPMTKQLLSKADVPVAAGRSFTQDHFDEALAYFQHHQAPLVIKPSNGRAGVGITTNITTLEQFRSGWSRAVEASTSKNRIMLEEQVSGLDVRAFVVGDRFVAAAIRLPAFVQGNGRDSLATLIDAKSALRSQNAYLQKMPIQADSHWLAQQDMTYSSVPEDGVIVLLNGTVSAHLGGEQVDITDELAPELQQIAVRAAQAIPGLTIAGIDLLVASPATAENAVVLEANSGASVSVHHNPAYGLPVDVAGAIMDEMLRVAPRPSEQDRQNRGALRPLLENGQRVRNRVSKFIGSKPRK